MLYWLTRYAQKQTHTVLGLMSGTSVDGMDAAVVEVEGAGETLRARLRYFLTVPFPEDVRQRVLRLCQGGDVREVCTLNFVLGELFADAALRAVADSGLRTNDVDLIGSHGQTVCHLPQQRATLQIGEPAVIAERTGITTVAEFRYRDIAAGGEGAPLVPYVDYLLFRHPEKNRIVQNIGGIANLTFLPAGGTLDDVRAFDTGPGNMVIDECVRLLTDGEKQFDEDGRRAAQGIVDEAWLNQLMQHPFFHRPPPKSTGREDFGRHFAEEFVQRGQQRGLSANDIIATATALTAESIAHSYRTLRETQHATRETEIILGGGGAFNPTLRRMLQQRVAPMRVLTHEDFGYHSGAKEAMAFAILAHETVMGAANNVPRATGAKRRVVLGKIVMGEHSGGG
ncbi:MAG: anhydro-N-acetylmuramic acid kinase [Abditibacteriales bacterium]|nr:anhydro-N-acetylmuramic acid kinase [Abditibacteriales bacterium]MDW8366505.1 anhydro-N-acetylmuramic acid kinase [Abditibacteriales bacterium]